MAQRGKAQRSSFVLALSLPCVHHEACAHQARPVSPSVCCGDTGSPLPRTCPQRPVAVRTWLNSPPSDPDLIPPAPHRPGLLRPPQTVPEPWFPLASAGVPQGRRLCLQGSGFARGSPRLSAAPSRSSLVSCTSTSLQSVSRVTPSCPASWWIWGIGNPLPPGAQR